MSGEGLKQKKAPCYITVVLLSLSLLVTIQFGSLGSANFIPPPPSPLPRIHINANGTVTPSTAPIQLVGGIFTLTRNLTDYVIEIMRDNVVLDGAGFSLSGKTHENGIVLAGRLNVTVKNFELKQFSSGIYVSNSTDCLIEGNAVKGSQRGIYLTEQSTNNRIYNNLLKNNTWDGILIWNSGGNTLKNNVMQENQFNLGISYKLESDLLLKLNNNIDASNKVDGKAVYYWFNQRNRAVPSGAGYVALINCTGITVQNLNLTKNRQGILLISTSNCTIIQNTVTGNNQGIVADRDSSHNIISTNYVFGNKDSGIVLSRTISNLIFNNTITGNSKNGIVLTDSENETLTANTIKSNLENGISLDRDINATITKNYVANGVYAPGAGAGIVLNSIANASISENTIVNNKVGLSIGDLLKNNAILGNIIKNNVKGVDFGFTVNRIGSNNLFRSNRLDDNTQSITFGGNLILNIDSSNTVNGKPIYLWVNQQNRTVPSDAGYIALINCNNITVEGITISGNSQGILLQNTKNSLITRNIFSRNNGHGVYVKGSSNNVFSENQIVSNTEGGIVVLDSLNNTFAKNYIASNEKFGIELCSDGSNVVGNNITANKDAGIEFNGAKNSLVAENFITHNGAGILHYWLSSQNRVIKNMIAENNGWGIRVEGKPGGSVFYQNNLIDNHVGDNLQVSIPWPVPPNTWDNGAVGNYWCDYKTRYPNAKEINNTGIGDTPYEINENNIDRYPLMEPVEVPTETTYSVLPLPYLSPSSTPNPSPAKSPSANQSVFSPTAQPTLTEPLQSGNSWNLPSSAYAAIIIVVTVITVLVIVAILKRRKPVS